MASKKEKTELKKLASKKTALLGFGLDNQALLALLEKHQIKAKITICDARPLSALPTTKAIYSKINYRLGASFNKNLDEFDILFRSPGWPVACPGITEANKIGRT